MSTYLSYDDSNMWSAKVGPNGATKNELTPLQKSLRKAHQHLEELRTSGEQGFFDLPYDTKIVASIQKQVAALKRSGIKHLIVVGIGGSDLGARTIWQALGNPKKGMWVSFLNNPDPEVLAHYTGRQAFWKHTAINVVSKSGTTLETLSIFFLLRAGLIATVGEKDHARHVVVTTEPTSNPLAQLAKQEGYALLPHPGNVGGRFSVLSVVGLFPAACGGVDVKKLLHGAKWVEESRRKTKEKHMSARFAALHYLAMTKRDQRLHVLMPYAEWLSNFSFWYRQLWAESLGKDKEGPTPIAALGTVDQHSQIQLYVDGAKDKVVTFVSVDHFRSTVRVPSLGNGISSSVQYMSGVSFEDIMHVEGQGTRHALTKARCPNGTLRLANISPESVGALFQFYMLATATLGELLGINAYNQPGVEEGKTEARRLLQDFS